MIINAAVSKLTKRPKAMELIPQSASDELLLKRIFECGVQLGSEGVGFKIFIQADNEDEDAGFQWEVPSHEIGQ